jgi:kynurenine formamidase
MFQPPDKVIDLSNPVDESMPVWPTLPSVTLEQSAWAARDGYTMEMVEMSTHTGTHIDSPLHFIPEGKTLEEFPIGKFMGAGVVLDLAPKEPEASITVSELEAFEDDIEAGDVVMLHTGWDQYHGRTPEYLFEFPYLTADAAEYLASLEPKAVGTDGASVGGWAGEAGAHGPAVDETMPDESHLPLLEEDILPIEELRNLGDVLDGADSRRAYFLYPPINYQGTSGASVRAFAFL